MNTLTIKKKITRNVDTKYGEKRKHSFLVAADDGEMWVNAWQNPTSDGWKEGQTITAEIKDREYKGKTYWDFVFPKFTPGAQSPVDNGKLDMISKWEAILKELGEIKALLKPEEGVFSELSPPPLTDNDMPEE